MMRLDLHFTTWKIRHINFFWQGVVNVASDNVVRNIESTYGTILYHIIISYGTILCYDIREVPGVPLTEYRWCRETPILSGWRDKISFPISYGMGTGIDKRSIRYILTLRQWKPLMSSFEYKWVKEVFGPIKEIWVDQLWQQTNLTM